MEATRLLQDSPKKGVNLSPLGIVAYAVLWLRSFGKWNNILESSERSASNVLYNWTSNAIKDILDKSRRPVCLREDAMLFLPSSDMQLVSRWQRFYWPQNPDLATIGPKQGPMQEVRFANKSSHIKCNYSRNEAKTHQNLRAAPELPPPPSVQ